MATLKRPISLDNAAIHKIPVRLNGKTWDASFEEEFNDVVILTRQSVSDALKFRTVRIKRHCNDVAECAL